MKRRWLWTLCLSILGGCMHCDEPVAVTPGNSGLDVVASTQLDAGAVDQAGTIDYAKVHFTIVPKFALTGNATWIQTALYFEQAPGKQTIVATFSCNVGAVAAGQPAMATPTPGACNAGKQSVPVPADAKLLAYMNLSVQTVTSIAKVEVVRR